MSSPPPLEEVEEAPTSTSDDVQQGPADPVLGSVEPSCESIELGSVVTPPGEIPRTQEGDDLKLSGEEAEDTMQQSPEVWRKVTGGSKGGVLKPPETWCLKLSNTYEPLARDETYDVADEPWWTVPSLVSGFARLMSEMYAVHSKRWGKKVALEPPADVDYRTTNSASALKRFFMRAWYEHKGQLCRAGDPLWWE